MKRASDWRASDISSTGSNMGGALGSSNRRNFVQLNSGEKTRLLEIIEEIIRKGNQNRMIVMPDTSQQNQLIASLDILSSTTGMFRKIKSSVKEANETARRLINEPGFLSGQSSILESPFKRSLDMDKSSGIVSKSEENL